MMREKVEVLVVTRQEPQCGMSASAPVKVHMHPSFELLKPEKTHHPSGTPFLVTLRLLRLLQVS